MKIQSTARNSTAKRFYRRFDGRSSWACCRPPALSLQRQGHLQSFSATEKRWRIQNDHVYFLGAWRESRVVPPQRRRLRHRVSGLSARTRTPSIGSCGNDAEKASINRSYFALGPFPFRMSLPYSSCRHCFGLR